jgi:hypothetical protein
MRPTWLVPALLVAFACQIFTDFTLEPLEESSGELCSDGRDNDFDGLTDCQDWNCLDQPVCCDIPEVILLDAFDVEAACDAAECAANCAEPRCGPDPDRWHTWPCPFSRVCDGALHLDKDRCFAAGVLSHAGAPLAPGLSVSVASAGRPERNGYVEIALTLQTAADLPGALDECGRAQVIRGFAAVRKVWDEDGARFTALLRDEVVGRSPPVHALDAGAEHVIGIAIGDDRRIAYSVDGEVFAVTDETVPETDLTMRLALSGLTRSVRFTSARMQAGRRCHDPTTWAPAGGGLEASVALDRDTFGATWDRSHVDRPVVRQVGGDIELYYTGCGVLRTDGECDHLHVGIGVASGPDGGALVRGPHNPIFTISDVPTQIGGNHHDMSVAVAPADGRLGLIAPAGGASIYEFSVADRIVVGEAVLPLGDGWEAGENCCPAVVELDGTTYVWYVGRGFRDERTQIGLATSTDGGPLVRHPANPVLPHGGASAFDSERVSSPSVVWDPGRGLFRMWYEARDFFGRTSIGYAVSPDGVTWHKYPGNPILSPEALGIETLGGPSVLRDGDGRLRMWIHGTSPEDPGRRIFELRNDGALVGGE